MNYPFEDASYRFGSFRLDSRGLLFEGDRRILLEPIQSRVLQTLLRYGGRTVTKSELIERAWNGGTVSDESISRAIYKLRQALGGVRDQYIESISGIGYRLGCPVKREPLSSTQTFTGLTSLDYSNSASALALLNTARALASDYEAMVGYWGADLRCQYANAAYEVWFGRSQSSMIGISMPELLGPLFNLNLPYINGVKNGFSQHFTRSIPLPHGLVRRSLASYFPDFRDGRVCGFSVLVVDAERFEAR